MNTYFAIAKINYEYNDEIYYTSEDGAYQVTEIYKTKEKAEEFCFLENLKFWNSIDFYYYGYKWNDVVDDYNLKRIFDNNGIDFEFPEIYDGSKELIKRIFELPEAEQKKCFDCFIIKKIQSSSGRIN